MSTFGSAASTLQLPAILVKRCCSGRHQRLLCISLSDVGARRVAGAPPMIRPRSALLASRWSYDSRETCDDNDWKISALVIKRVSPSLWLHPLLLESRWRRGRCDLRGGSSSHAAAPSTIGVPPSAWLFSDPWLSAVDLVAVICECTDFAVPAPSTVGVELPFFLLTA